MNKQHEMYMANANQTLAHPTHTIFNWLMLGLALGLQGLALGLQGLVLGLQGFVLGQRGFSDTNMLVTAIQMARVGGRTQLEDQMGVILRCSGI